MSGDVLSRERKHCRFNDFDDFGFVMPSSDETDFISLLTSRKMIREYEIKVNLSYDGDIN